MIKGDKIILTIICDELNDIEETISWYNSTYKTDFKVIDYIYDEVNFAKIEVNFYKLEDLFDLGYNYGWKVARNPKPIIKI